MIPSWAGKMLVRLAFLVTCFALLIGGVWLMTGNSAGSKAAVAPTGAEPAAKPRLEPVARAPDLPPAPPKDGKPPHLIEVDLSKLPPDLVQQLQGAIVEKQSKKPTGER